MIDFDVDKLPRLTFQISVENVLDMYLNIPKNKHILKKRRDYFRSRREQYWDEITNDTRCFCHCCSVNYRLELHHIIPLEMGGSNNRCNVVPMCHKCHVKAHLLLGIKYYEGCG